jgi:hypothetical protein
LLEVYLDTCHKGSLAVGNELALNFCHF